MCQSMRRPRCVYLQCRCSESKARCVLYCNRPSFSRRRSLCVYGYVHIQPYSAHCQWLYVRLHVGLFASHLCRCVLYVYELRYACISIRTCTLYMNHICSRVDGCAQLLLLHCQMLSTPIGHCHSAVSCSPSNDHRV